MIKEFLIWLHEEKKSYTTLEEIKEKFANKTDALLLELTPYFDMHPKFGITLKPKFVMGILDVKKTIAFLIQETDDLKLEHRDLGSALNGDLVLVEKHRKFNKVVLIVKSSLVHIIAEVRKTSKFVRFIPEIDTERFIVVESLPEYLVDGQIVLLKVKQITPYQILCELSEIIGHKNDPDIDVLKIVFEYNWPTKFSNEILEELENIHVDYEFEINHRRDLTDKLIVTIDGADAKDLDDAVSIEKINGNYHVGVHIADVSYFVKEGSLIDEEAYKRATSVYLADRVIPMLPHGLSNDLCSLNPFEKKYTLSCQMVLDKELEVISYEIFPSIIESKRRFTYAEVNTFLHEGGSFLDNELDQMMIIANEIGLGLKKKRTKRGAIDFSSSELKFIIDPKTNEVLDVEERKTDDAEGLIESLMILANETVAAHFFKNHLPGIYRIHEKPDLEKLEKALLTVERLGFVAKKTGNQSKLLQILTDNATNTPYEYVVHTTLLRAMQKAKYSNESLGHFGLGSLYYSHFTSPIRRYPDLFLHRMIRELMFDKKGKKTLKYFERILPDVADHTSLKERNAISMERDVAKLKSCVYMQDKIGETYDASIVSLTQAGMFVKLTNGIEGFIALRDQDQYFNYDETNLLFFTNSGKTYRLGDKIKVVLTNVNMQEKQISFNFLETKHEKEGERHENTRSKQKGNSRLHDRRKTRSRHSTPRKRS